MVAPINVKIVGDSTGLHTAVTDAGKTIDLFGGKLSTDLPGWAGVAVEATQKVGKAVFESGKAAKDAAAEEQIFADSMSAIADVTPESEQKIRDAIEASQKLAFTDSETAKAILSLTTATGDADAALDLLAV